MKTMLGLFLLIAVVAAFPTQMYSQVDPGGEWEFVPLTGGHVSFFVPNPYNENDLFAVCDNAPGSTPYAHIFYSSDRGRNWRLTGNDLLDMGEVKDMAVAKNGWLYLTYSLRRSTDWGKTWEKAQCNGLDGNAVGMTMRSMPDGRMWLLQQNPRKLFYSDDYGVNWIHFQTPYDDNGLLDNFSLFFFDQTIAIYGTSGLLAYTNNHGVSWRKDSTFGFGQYITDFNAHKDNGQIVFRMWVKTFNTSSKPHWLDYYESKDSGYTWVKVNNSPITDFGLPFNKANSRSFKVTYPNNTILSLFTNRLYRSFDQGKTWNIDELSEYSKNKPVNDIYLYSDTLIASINGLGIVRSIDTGRTWLPVQSLGEMAAFDRIELKTAGDYYCALLCNQEYSRYVVSSDKGNTWTDVFSTESNLRDLSITTIPEPRYTIVLNNNTVINGLLLQTKPDTVLSNLLSSVLPSNQSPVLQATPADRGSLFLSLQDGTPRHFLHSCDGGQTWIKTACLSGYVACFYFYPALRKPGSFIAALPSSDQAFSMGYWLVENYGDRWTHQQWQPVRAWEQYCVYKNDIFFTTWDYDFSYDYAHTFIRLSDGIAPEDYGSGHLALSANETLFFVHGSGTVWYYFDGSSWNKLHYKSGMPVSYYRPSSLWYEDGILWGTFPGHGVYKTINPVITGINPLPKATTNELAAYPNPFHNTCTIALPNNNGYATIAIYNTLGKLVFTTTLKDSEIPYTWDGRGNNDKLLPSGAYIVEILSHGLTKKTLVLFQ